MWWRSVVGVAAAVVAVAACSGAASTAPASTLPLAEPPAQPTDSGLTDDLAPSQVTASTIAAPITPGPCDLADLEFWTANVVVGELSADAVIRVRNNGQLWCEPDISGSPLVDPAIEPDVWLDPGGWADLVVGQSGRECFDPAPVTLAQIDVDGEAVVVPTAAVAACGWRLTAFFPNEVATSVCEQVAVAVVDGFVLVRNPALTPCRLGELLEADGNGASTKLRTDSSVAAIVSLAAGDVVAFARTVDPTVDCDAESGSVELAFSEAGVVEAPEVGCGAIFEAGAGRPWFGAPDGPLQALRGDAFDLDRALSALDPFAPLTGVGS